MRGRTFFVVCSIKGILFPAQSSNQHDLLCSTSTSTSNAHSVHTAASQNEDGLIAQLRIRTKELKDP